MKLSIIIITKNVQNTIRRSLDSVKWADEIVVVDSGSTDDTVSICREYTDKILVTDWPGYGIQKNRALDLANGDWVLSLDADEIVTDKLAQEIQSTLTQPNASAYDITIKLIFYGQVIKHAVGSDKHTRLFKRTASRFTDSQVHEKIIVNGNTRPLKHSIEHHSFNDIQHLVTKMNHYTSISAHMKFAKGYRPSALRAVANGLWTFFRLYCLNLGFLDGMRGLVLAVSFAEGAYYRYIKCTFLSEGTE